MMTANDHNREALLEELDLHKTEFTALRQEILQWLDTERQNLNLSLVAIGAGLSFAPLLIDQKIYSLLLLFPFVFHVLLAEMLYSIRVSNNLSDYLTDTLIPRVNELLEKLGDEHSGITVLGWESRVAAQPVRKSDLLLASLTPTRHWVPILAIATLLIAYVFIINSQGYTPTAVELLLVAINLLLLIFAAARNTFTARTAMQKAQKLRQHTLQTNSGVRPDKRMTQNSGHDEKR